MAPAGMLAGAILLSSGVTSLGEFSVWRCDVGRIPVVGSRGRQLYRRDGIRPVLLCAARSFT